MFPKLIDNYSELIAICSALILPAMAMPFGTIIVAHFPSATYFAWALQAVVVLVAAVILRWQRTRRGKSFRLFFRIIADILEVVLAVGFYLIAYNAFGYRAYWLRLPSPASHIYVAVVLIAVSLTVQYLLSRKAPRVPAV